MHPRSVITSTMLGLAGLSSTSLRAQPDPCAALGTSYITVQAAPLGNATVIRIPWQGGPAQEPAGLVITVAQENGQFLTGGVQPITAAFVTPGQGGPAVDVTVGHESRAQFPLAGTKTVRAEWSEGEGAKRFCSRVRVLARQPTNLTSEWVVDGRAQPQLPADVSGASSVQLRVSGQGLWQDVRLELDKRLSDQGVALVAQTPALATTAAADVALFNVKPLPAAGVTGARYSLSLQNEGWATPGNLGIMALPSVEVYGRPPRLLLNAEGDGQYRVSSTSLAPTITLRGQHLGFDAERLTVNITAHHGGGTTALQPITKVLAPCATDAKTDCLTTSFSRPVPGVQRYSVQATTFDGQTSNVVDITPSTTRFDFTKIESETGVTNKQAVFAGRMATLTITLPATHPVGMPDSATLDGLRIPRATFTSAPGVLRLSMAVPALTGNIDRVTRNLAVIYPDYTTGVGTVTVYRVPELSDAVVIYGLKPYSVRVGGAFLSDVSIGDGLRVKVQDVTVGTSAVRATFTSDAAGPFTARVPVTRLGEHVTDLQVTVLDRLPLSQVARWGITDAPACAETNLPLSTDLQVPPGGALCIRIEPDPRALTLDVQDTVAINVMQDEKPIGTETRLGYRAAHGSQFLRLPLTGVEQGTRVTVGVQPTTTEPQQPAQGEARTLLSRKQRIGLFASVTAFAFRIRSDEARVAEEAAVTQTVTDLAGQVGVFVRPFPANRDYTAFAGVQRLTRSFCQNLSNSELGLGVGVSIHDLFSIGVGIPLESSKTPTTCEDLPEGEVRPTVKTGSWYIMLGAPVLKLLSF